MPWAPDYVTLAEAKDYQRIPDTADDDVIGMDVAAASRAIDNACNRQFGLVVAPEVRVFTPEWSRYHQESFIELPDLSAAATLTAEQWDSNTATWIGVADWRLGPANAESLGRPWTVAYFARGLLSGGTDSVRLTGDWGWATVPEAIKAATLLQTSRFLARRDSPFGVAGSPDSSSEIRLLARVDPDVAVAVADYRRPRLVFG